MSSPPHKAFVYLFACLITSAEIEEACHCTESHSPGAIPYLTWTNSLTLGCITGLLWASICPCRKLLWQRPPYGIIYRLKRSTVWEALSPHLALTHMSEVTHMSKEGWSTSFLLASFLLAPSVPTWARWFPLRCECQATGNFVWCKLVSQQTVRSRASQAVTVKSPSTNRRSRMPRVSSSCFAQAVWSVQRIWNNRKYT